MSLYLLQRENTQMPRYLISWPNSLSLLINCVLISLISGLLGRIMFVFNHILETGKIDIEMNFVPLLGVFSVSLTVGWNLTEVVNVRTVLQLWYTYEAILFPVIISECTVTADVGSYKQLRITCRINPRKKESFWILCCWKPTPKEPQKTTT